MGTLLGGGADVVGAIGEGQLEIKEEIVGLVRFRLSTDVVEPLGPGGARLCGRSSGGKRGKSDKNSRLHVEEWVRATKASWMKRANEVA